MSGLDDLIAKAKANKKILIPAAAIGGVAAIYVISKNGIPGAAGGASPGAGDPGGALPGGGGSGGGDQPSEGAGGFMQALQQLTDQFTKYQTDNAAAQGGFQDSITRAIADVVSQVNSQLAQQQENVNAALANIPTQGAGQFGGLDSLFSQFAGLQATLPNVLPSNLPPISASNLSGLKRIGAGKTPVDLASQIRPPNTYGRSSALPSLATRGASSISNAFSGLKRSVPSFRPAPAQIARNPFGSFAGFNKLSSGGSGSRGVPFGGGSGYVPYVTGKLPVPRPTFKASLNRSPFARR